MEATPGATQETPSKEERDNAMSLRVFIIIQSVKRELSEPDIAKICIKIWKYLRENDSGYSAEVVGDIFRNNDWIRNAFIDWAEDHKIIEKTSDF